jgi:Na+-translocating ferredoxin:NAD+ oxidoreductase RnfC subunit
LKPTAKTAGLNAMTAGAITRRSREALIERIHQFGVAGLGGAGFPTGAKLRGGGDKSRP